MTNKCLYVWIKRLFVSQPQPQKKSKRWKWIIAKLKGRKYPALTPPPPPPPPPPPERTLSHATQEQRKHAMTVALATAAAAEAAVAAAHAAAEVVRLTGNSPTYRLWTHKDANMAAATKIQTVFRGYLARKALRALKGVVRLQAIIRGQAVRRQTQFTLKHMLSNEKMQLIAQEITVPGALRSCKADEKKCILPNEDLMTKEIKSQLECSSQRNWDCSMLLKDDADAIWNKKQEATIKRERMLKYSHSQRERRSTNVLEDSLYHKENERRIFRLQQRSENKETRNRSFKSNLTNCDFQGSPHLKLRNIIQHDSLDDLALSVSFPRRSFSRDSATCDESSVPNSPALPTYMALTKSARAKERSMSMPKQRMGFYETYA